MQYIIQKNLSNLKNSKLISLYDNVPFIFVCLMTYNICLVARKSITKVLHQKVARLPKCFLSSYQTGYLKTV